MAKFTCPKCNCSQEVTLNNPVYDNGDYECISCSEDITKGTWATVHGIEMAGNVAHVNLRVTINKYEQFEEWTKLLGEDVKVLK